MKPEMRIFLRAFLDGLTGAGLFRRLEIPGAPTQLFDTRSVEEVVASGEFDETCERLGKSSNGPMR